MSLEKKVLRLKDGDTITVKKDLKEHLMRFGFHEEDAVRISKMVFLEGVSYVSAKAIQGQEKIKERADELMKEFLDKNHTNRTPPVYLLKLFYDVIRKISDHYLVMESDMDRCAT